MSKATGKKISRRSFIKLTATAMAAGPFFSFPDCAYAAQKKLRIAKWAHFIPDYDQWFEHELAAEWGKQHDTKVTVDHIPVEQVHEEAAAEVKASKGHDVFMFPWPPAEYYQHVIDHDEIYQTVAMKYGQIDFMGHRSTFYPKVKKRFAFADSWIPMPLHFYSDYWGEVGMPLGPVHYDGLHVGARKIREKLGIPCGLALTPTLEGNITLHTLLIDFGSGVLNVRGDVILDKGVRTMAALKYAKALYGEAGSPEQLTWSSAGNVKAMVSRRTNCSLNGISLLRTAEKQDPQAASKIMLQPPLIGSAGAGIAAVPHVTNCSVVWNFAQNQEGARQFIADLVDNSKTAYERSQGCNFPFFQKTLPDIIVRLSHDPHADPPDKYMELKDALHWTHDLGVPGYATPAFMEVFNSFVIPRMFLSVIKGELSLEDATRTAGAEVQRIAENWKQIS
jgi:multiple sugar transport system substrate-binding protein